MPLKAAGVECYYSRTVRRYRGASIAKNQSLQRRLDDAERLLQTVGLLDQLHSSTPALDSNEQESQVASKETIVDEQQSTAQRTHDATTSHCSNSTSNAHQVADTSPTTLDFEDSAVSLSAASLNQHSHQPDAAESSRDEVHGPNSYLSICADPGAEWIASRIGASNYATCATTLFSTISRKLKLCDRLRQDRKSDPPLATAWLYTMG